MSSESQFDASTFLDSTLTEATTRRPPLPAGADFPATILDVGARPWQKKDDPTKHGIAIDVKLSVDVTPELQATGQPPNVTMNDSIMLSTKDDGSIDNSPGASSSLRRYRDALDMNKDGEAFSFRQMIGRRLTVRVKHDLYQGELYDKVDSVAKLA